MIVLDASIVVKVLSEEPGSDAAVDRISIEANRIAPDWVTAEVANAMSKKVRYTDLTIDLARRYVAAIPEILTDIVDSAALFDRALDLSVRLKHAFYDCLYLALAIDENAILLTADRRFFAAAEQEGFGDRIELLSHGAVYG